MWAWRNSFPSIKNGASRFGTRRRQKERKNETRGRMMDDVTGYNNVNDDGEINTTNNEIKRMLKWNNNNYHIFEDEITINNPHHND